MEAGGCDAGMGLRRQSDLLPEHDDDDPGPASDNERDNVERDICVMILAQMMQRGRQSVSIILEVGLETSLSRKEMAKKNQGWSKGWRAKKSW